MKKFTSFCLAVVAMMLLATPQAKAIITDPDDYIIWDSGIFADSTNHAKFVLPDFMIWSPGVAFKGDFSELGRNFKDDYMEDFGFKPGEKAENHKNTTKIGGLVINARKATDESAVAAGERFELDYADFLKLKGDEANLPWTYSKTNNKFYRPSDSIVIKVPKTCDSIFIQGCGSNTYYSLFVYEVGVSEFLKCDKGVFHGLGGITRTNVYHIGGNWGEVREIGFKPQHVAPGDSTTIVILGSCKDYFADNEKGNRTHFCKDSEAIKNKQTYTGVYITNEDGTVRDRYVSSERWGLWEGTSINRIKIYGTIEKGDIPVYDGTHSAFTFSYQTRPSGTVELTKPLKQENGWSGTAYTRYASDLGVVRSVLSASSYIYLGYDKDFGSFATKLNVISATHDSTCYDTVAEHANYFEITVPTTGFQDLTMNFDYAIRGANNQVIVAAYIKGDAACAVLDTLDNSANPTKELAHASVAIPNEFANQKNLIIRIMMGKGALSGTTEFDLANLEFKGYNDFYPSAEGATKVAYLTPAKDRVHVLGLSDGADSADVVLPYLFANENVNVSVISREIWQGLSSEEAILAAFEDYDVVVASPYMTVEDLSFAQVLIGKKPYLNFNADAFMAWNAGATSVSDALDTAMIYSEEFYYHPLFANIDLDEEKMTIPNIFDAVAANVQVGAAEGTYVLATANNSGAAVIFEDYSNPKAKYLFVDMFGENSNSINSKGEQLLLNAISYLKKGGEFVKPTFELNASGAVVENAAQFAAAVDYDYGVLNLTSPVIKMKTSTDANGIYDVTAGISYGGNNITFQPYSAEDNVVIYGEISDATKLKASSLTFKNITFNATDGQSSLITLRHGDKVSNELKFENCTFNNLKGSFVSMHDSVCVKTITLTNNVFNAAEIGGLVRMEGLGITNNTINVKENIFYDLAATSLLDWQTANTKEMDSDDEDGDEILSVNVSNNTFRNKTVVDGMSLIAMDQVQNFDQVSVVVNNNLFYNMGQVGVTLFPAPAQQIYAIDEAQNDTVDFVSVLDLNKNFVEGSELALTVVEGGAAEWDTTYFASVTKDSLALDKVFEDEALTQISKLSPMYTGGVQSGLERAYLGALANYVSRQAGDETTFVVKNAPELKTALELAIGGDIIELETNVEDTLGVYQLGMNGFKYPNTGGKLIIRAAEGHTPVLFGNIAPSNADVNLDELYVENLTWADPTVWEENRIEGYSADAYSPFYFRSTNGYIGLFHITNSAFKNLEMQAVVRTNKCYDEAAGTGLTIGEILMDYNEFDNFGGATPDGKVAYHFIQFDVKGTYTINNFTFIENIVKNFHGSQLFNINREGSLNAADSTINIKIINNLFYKIGGNAPDKYRNFLEFNKTPVGHTVNIDITNNVFYKRWSEVLTGQYPQGQLDLFDGSQVKAYTINIKKNYFEGEYYNSDESYGCNPMALTDAGSDKNLSLSSASAVEVNRDAALDWNNVNDYIELDENTEDFANSVDQGADVFGLGEEHPYNPEYKYIGVGLMYGIGQMEAPDAIEDVQVAKFTVFANNGKLFINVAEKAQVEIYHISGKKVAAQALNAGLNELGSLNNGLYILNIDGHMAKVMVK